MKAVGQNMDLRILPGKELAVEPYFAVQLIERN
jgi:hypothetical protein